MSPRGGAMAAAALALLPAAAAAQGRVEMGIGAGRLGAASIRTSPATLTANSGNPFTLFATDTELGSATFGSAAVGVAVLPYLDVEVRGTYGEPVLATRITQDAEGAEPVELTETIREFTAAAVGVVHPSRWRVGPRAALFAAAGLGYLRHLHDGDGYAADGRIYLAGGGAKFRLGGGSGRVKALGLRLDAAVTVRDGPAVLDDAIHVSPLAGASFYLRF